MKTKPILVAICIITMLFLTSGGSAAPSATPLGSAFTYQGRLDRGGKPYTGACYFQFSLWDAETDGLDIGDVINFYDQPVVNGLFTVQLDFGAGAFNGDARWLEVVVQCPGDSTPTVFPRQQLTATPYALYATSAPWSGLVGVPAGFTDNVDDNTTYAAGNGLVLATTTFSIDSSYTQRRVSGACSVGSTIREIKEDGSVTCQTDSPLNRLDPPRNNVITAYSGVGNAFYMNRFMIGSDGYGFFAYFDNTAYDLMVAHCENLECTTTTVTWLETGGMVGGYTSSTIGSDGLALISYIDDSNSNLKVAHCTNLACTSAEINTIDSTGDVGFRTAITIGADGLGLISYYDRTLATLKVAHCNNILCSSANTNTLDTVGGDVFNGVTTVLLGWDGLGLIGYYDIANARLRVAHCSNTACSTATLSTVATDVGAQHSLTIGADGLGLISYFDDALIIAHCDNTICTSSTLSTVVVEGNIGWYPNITIGADYLPIIVYMKSGNRLAVAHCNDRFCSGINLATPDLTGGGSGAFSVITIGIDGLPLIAYRDEDTQGFKVLHCASIACAPYFKR